MQDDDNDKQKVRSNAMKRQQKTTGFFAKTTLGLCVAAMLATTAMAESETQSVKRTPVAK